MDDEIGQNLRIYNRQLTAQLKDKDGEFADLQKRFSKLQGRFAQLDYAFKKNLQLHQQQMISIHDLRLSQKELRKVEKDRWEQFCKLEDQLTKVTNEKEASKNGLIYWKQTVIDQRKFYEGKFEECLRGCNLKMEAYAIVHQRTLRETQHLAEKRIQEFANRCKLNEEEGELLRKKAIVLRGDVDVLRHRTQELASLIESFSGINEDSKGIDSCIVEVLRSSSTPRDDYDERIKDLRQELLRRIARPAVKPEGDTSEYETLKSQNLVLREVVKKLKTELAKIRKREEVILPKALLEEKPETGDLRKGLVEQNSKNKKLSNLLAEKDADLRQLEMENKKNMEKLETSLELIKSRDNEGRENSSETNGDSNNCDTLGKGMEAEKEFVNYYASQERRDLNDDKRQEAYWELLQKGRVKKFKEQPTRDTTMKSPELNFESLKSGRRSGNNYLTLKDKQKVEDDNGSYLNPGKNTHSKFSQGRLEPVESHSNSVRYEEYTIPLSINHTLKIRYPIAEKIFRFRSVYSVEEYHSVPIDEAVLYFDRENQEPVFLEPKIANCAVQTILISTANVSTQTTASNKTFNSQATAGVKILNSEKQAIERSLRDLEKTVSKAGDETLGLARSLIVRTGKFPPGEEFFDCVKYLSECGAM